MYLITGGAGFVGLNTAMALAETGADVVITTRRRNDPMAQAVIAQSGGKIILEVIDLNNPHEVSHLFARYDFAGVIHAATNHMFSQSRSANWTSYNMLMNTLESATAAGVKRFVLAGSFVVYRGVKPPWREDATFAPGVLPGGTPLEQRWPLFEVALKRVMEILALDYGTPMKSWDQAPAAGHALKHQQLETAVVRFPAQCGPMYTSMYSGISNLVHALAKGWDRIPETREVIPWMDLCYVRDSASALKTVLLAEKLPNRIYNVSSKLRVTAKDIIDAAVRVAPKEAAKLKLLETPRASERTDYYVDISRIEADFGWTPKFASLDAVISDYMEWLRNHPW
jgi:nucleoside-diphosphate-sugar epimerase